MRSCHRLAALILLTACGGGGSGDTYTSVADDAGTLELKPGGAFTFTLPGLGTTQGTYTVEGEKILLTMDGQTHTLLKTGNCLEDSRQLLGRMCIGGKAGDAANTAEAASGVDAGGPSGTWKSTSDQGDFTLVFQPGNTLAMTLSVPGTPPETLQGTFVVEGRTIHAKLGPGGDPLVLTFVNNAYETTSFGVAMKFVKQ